MSVPTADEFVRRSFQLSDSYDYKNHVEKLIEFARLHCEAQAKAIYEKGLSELTEWSGNPYSGEGSDELKLELIQEAYPLNLIK